MDVVHREVVSGRRICVGKHEYALTRSYRYSGVTKQYMFTCRNCGNPRLISKAAFWRR